MTGGRFRTCHPVILSLALFILATPPVLQAFEFFPSEADTTRYYARIWNPLSNGPNLTQIADTPPKGQIGIRPFLFSEVGERQYGNQLSASTSPARTHLYQASPLVQTAYGITNHITVGTAFAWDTWWSRDTTRGGNPNDQGGGFGETALYLALRHVIQDPDGWRPTVTSYHQLGLPTDRWSGATAAPGGFLPLGRLPATRDGAVGITEGLLLRKNVRPFRLNAGAYYTYTAPGHRGGDTVYAGDLVNTRLAIEHFLDDARGFGYAIELVTLHGLPFRADGHNLNVTPRSFNILGIGPTLQYKFTENWLAGAGVLFTVAGQNAIGAFYPNFSIYYYWQGGKKIVMR